jgi:hypothetical protein
MSTSLQVLFMTKKFILSLFLLLVLCFGAIAASEAEDIVFQSLLTVSGGVSGAVGEAIFMLREESLEYRLEIKGVSDITMAHLHHGRIGDLSTPVVWLYPKSPPPKLIPGEFSGTLAEGTITATDLVGPWRGRPISFLVNQMRDGDVFVNVHARRHAAGEICGPVTAPAQ